MTEFPNREGRDPDLSRHILPSAATMVGICTTLIGLVKIIETRTGSRHVDEYGGLAALLFLVSALASYLAAVAGYLVTAGWIPWTYPIALFAVGLIGWGFVAVRRSRRAAPAPSARGGRPGLELWDTAGRTINQNPGKR